MVVNVVSKKNPSTQLEEQNITTKNYKQSKWKWQDKLITKVVESMVERTPEYFRQCAKQYRYFICQSEPIFDLTKTRNFAYSLIMNDDFYKVPGFHYHVTASNDQLPDSFKSTAFKQFSIACIFTSFVLLINTN